MTEEKNTKKSADVKNSDVAKEEKAPKEAKKSASVKDSGVTKEEKKESASAEGSGETKQELKPGMTVRVFQKIKELNLKGEEKERTQYFEGIIIARKHGKEKGGTITVRKVSDGVGVEKIFPLNLPTIEKIEVKKQARVRRAKLYFLRDGYKKKLKEKVLAK